MNHTKFLNLLLVLLIVLSACEDDSTDPNDDDEDDDVPVSITLVQNWNVGSLTEGGSSGDAQNTTVQFNESGTYTIIIPGFEGLGTTGIWTLVNDGENIVLDDGSNQITADIVSINENQMVLEFDFENFKGETTTYRITLTR